MIVIDKIIIAITLTLAPGSPGGPESPGNPIGPYGQKQMLCVTLTDWLPDIQSREKVAEPERQTHKVAFGSILAWCSSGSWRPSCTGRARVTLLPHVAFTTLGHQQMRWQSLKGHRGNAKKECCWASQGVGMEVVWLTARPGSPTDPGSPASPSSPW